MSVALRFKKNFVPPIFLKRKRIESRLAAFSLRLVASEPLEALRYKQLSQEVAKHPEINTLFPPNRMREHWGYARLENEPDSPNLYIHQLRYYRMFQYFRQAYPDIFQESTTILNVGDTSGLLLRAINKPGTSLNIRPDRVAYMCSKGIEAVQGDAEALQFEDETFDYVFCFQTLEHVKAPLKVLYEMGRVARKAVFVSIPHVEQTKIWERERFIREYRGADDIEALTIEDDECHVFEFSSSDLIKLLTYTALDCADNFTLDYFEDGAKQPLVQWMVRLLTPSHFNFFALEKRTT